MNGMLYIVMVRGFNLLTKVEGTEKNKTKTDTDTVTASKMNGMFVLL